MPATSTESAVLDEFNYILEKIVIVVPPTAMPYQCPVNGYVDCMPILDETKKKVCSDEAMDWYKANCPNFQGAAL